MFFLKWHFKNGKNRNPKIPSFRTMTLLTFQIMESPLQHKMLIMYINI